MAVDGDIIGRTGGVPERPHVLTLVDGLTGGAETFARLLLMNLDVRRYRRTLCVTRSPSDPAEEELVRNELHAAGVGLLMLRRTSRADLRPWLRLGRFLRRESVDILHAHKFGSNVWASLLRQPVRIAIAHEHTWSYEGKPLRRLLDRELIARRCDRFLSVSNLDRDRMIAVEGIDPARIEVIPVGIPDRPPTTHDIRGELGISVNAPVVVSVAYLRRQKALEVLVEAADDLRARHPMLRVLLVGDGDERPALEAAIRARGLQDTVLLLGRRRDALDVISEADVAVCTSDYEGTPQAVLEYMAAAKPVVATEVGGLPDLVVHGQTGWLVAPRSPSAIAARLDELLSDRARAAEMGARGRDRQLAEFSLAATMSRLQQVYEDLLESEAQRREGAC